MSKKVDRYWEIEYQLQLLWEIPHHVRDYPLISKLNSAQNKIINDLRDEERRQMEDVALTHH